MKKGIVLKVISAIAFAATSLPLLAFCDVNTYQNVDPWRLVIYYGIIAAVAAFGYAASALIPEKKLLNALLRVIGALTFFVGLLSLVMGGDDVTVFALGCGCVLGFFVGQRFHRKNFAGLYPLYALGIFIVLSIGCYIAAYAVLEEKLFNAVRIEIVACFTAEFIIAALLVNQSGIYDRSNRRKETKTTLPHGLSAYNAALVLGITVTGLTLCVFREQIAAFLTWVIVALIELFMELMKLFSFEPPDGLVDEAVDPTGFLLVEKNENYILQAILTIITVVVIFLFRKHLFSIIKSFFAMLGNFFGSRTEENEKVDFTDVFEDLQKDKNRRAGRTGYNDIARLYRAEKDPARKFRLGYRLLLYRISSLGKKLTPADTPSEQAEKGAELFENGELKTVAGYYERLRYNDEDVSGVELEALGRLIGKERL